MAEQYRAGAVLVEDAASGIQLIQELSREGFARIIPVKPLGDKVMRMRVRIADGAPQRIGSAGAQLTCPPLVPQS